MSIITEHFWDNGFNFTVTLGAHREVAPLINNERCRTVWIVPVGEKNPDPQLVPQQGQMCLAMFDDIDTPEQFFSLMTPGQAKVIADFLKNASFEPDVHIIISCPGGVSRSAAVFAAFENWLGEKNGKVWKVKCPNMHVFNLMMEAFEEDK